MGNCTSECIGTGLGITQILMGVWFIPLIFTQAPFVFWVNQVTKGFFLASVAALFISSGSLVIAGAHKKTKGLVTAAFVLSTLASLLAFGLLIYSAKFIYDGATSHRDFAPLAAMVFTGIVGVPTLVMFIVATISAVRSGKVLFCLNLSFILILLYYYN